MMYNYHSWPGSRYFQNVSFSGNSCLTLGMFSSLPVEKKTKVQSVALLHGLTLIHFIIEQILIVVSWGLSHDRN